LATITVLAIVLAIVIIDMKVGIIVSTVMQVILLVVHIDILWNWPIGIEQDKHKH